MKLSIGHRLFLSVLLAIVAVAAAAVMLMRHNVMSGFSDYAVGIELDRLDELSGDLSRRYREAGGWQFLPSALPSRQRWIAEELGRLQVARGLPAPPPPPPAPEAPAPPPPPPGAFVAPPLPPPVIPLQAPENASELGLQDRVTLLDASGGYLAGRPEAAADASARRPIVAAGVVVGHLAVTKATLPSDAMAGAFMERMKNSLWIIVAASVGLSALAAVLLAAHFRKPILRLAHGARELAAGRYETRLDAARSDELGDLAASFNQLAARLDQVESSRRQWVADTSHELRTPLSVLRAQLEAMQDGVRPASEQNIEAMLRQVLALNKLIDQLYTLARADVGELDLQAVPLDLWQLACDHAQGFAERFAAASMTFSAATAAAPCIVVADPDRIRQILTNLFENCIRYCGPGTGVVMSARRHGGQLELLIDDSGPGVPEAALEHLAERFYRVDASRSRQHGGAGLGLSLSLRIAMAHGGALAFARSPLGGLQARLTLAAP
ncbi:HAMP domain-containing protein [Massilia sp. PAMC28688]|uniref:ATP-binding protein n=1 Tax=Massilia sp. PAMC28688 TaxID=2861283 RepID=UPI001C629E49|nr:ATP-binding protein [Massilia sp. PAMC28688]QYF92274.1 HAMP domain-containing protein [Massilia sp. PAMC28688]